ncbi:hypothetical protein, partial [Pseudomonas aeruginosa]
HIHRSATPGAGAVLGEYLDSSICTEFIAAFGALRQASLLDSVRCCFRWGAVGFFVSGRPQPSWILAMLAPFQSHDPHLWPIGNEGLILVRQHAL